jgi:hypothetical protein
MRVPRTRRLPRTRRRASLASTTISKVAEEVWAPPPRRPPPPKEMRGLGPLEAPSGARPSEKEPPTVASRARSDMRARTTVYRAGLYPTASSDGGKEMRGWMGGGDIG